jgi:cytidylate kinase
MKNVYNIAIDGPSGSGKSTVAKGLSKLLDIMYLDTGAMYRGAAHYVLQRGADPANEAQVLSILDGLQMDIIYDKGEQKVFVCGADVTPYIREHNISMAASTVSKIPAVRIKLVKLQREIAKKATCVLDGRDIGTYVLPDAKFKFFLDASIDVRAKRRYDELKQRGADVNFDEVKQDMAARDEQDSKRDFAPLKPADDAVIIDTSSLKVDEVIEKLLKVTINK